jgi:tetratricopeptide (TPR) repeat protein
MPVNPRERAEARNERGRQLDRKGRTREAIREYELAREADPDWSVPHYNLGLIYKYAGDWRRSLECNQRAAALDPADQAGWWNLGIAATALGEWREARRGWRGCGIDVPEGDDPLDFPCGRTPVRLRPREDAEVVWSQRLDPARASILNIPFPESGFRWKDVVLNDGAPNGYRMLEDQEVPVFDCLALLERSAFSTFVAEVEMASAGDADQLAELAASCGLAAEDWSTSVEVLCKACSEGRPHARHDHAAPDVKGPHRIAIAARCMEDVRKLVDDWRAQARSVRILSITPPP